MENKKVIPITEISSVLLICMIVKASMHFTFIFGVKYSFNFVTLIEFALLVYLCVVLLLPQKRDLLILSALALIELEQIFHLIGHFHFYSLLCFIAISLMMIMAVFLGNFSFIKLKFERISDLCKKFYFVPSALLSVDALIGIVLAFMLDNITQYGISFVLLVYLPIIVRCVSIFLISYWLANPNAKQIAQDERKKRKETEETERSNNKMNNNIVSNEKTVNVDDIIKKHFNCQSEKNYRRVSDFLTEIIPSLSSDEEIVYGFFAAMMLKNGGRESVTGIVSVLTNKRYYYSGSDGKSSIFFPQAKSGSVSLRDVHAVTIGTQALQGSYVAFETKNDDYKIMVGADISDATPIKAKFEEVIRIQQESEGGGATIQAALSPADELKKFKELLDMGIITQEEFDAKKKQLLGL